MNWFLIALLPPALWAITNHFDKYLLSKYFKSGGVGALIVFSSLIGLVLLPIIAIMDPAATHYSINSALVALNGFLYILASLAYFYALQKDETSICVPLFQLIPVFSFILGYFVLGETLTSFQIIGGIVIIAGSIFLALDLTDHKKPKLKHNVLWLMALSSVLYALNFLFFKYFAIQSNFLHTSFWEYVGFAIFAFLLMIFVPSYRRQFLEVLKTNRTNVIGLNGINEVINIFAKASFNFASLLAPVTLIWIVDGLQPLFVFLFGILLTLFFPKVSQENISKKALAQKIIAIAIMFIGAYLINRN